MILSIVVFILRKRPLNDILLVLLPLIFKGIEYAEIQNDYDVWNKSEEKLNCAVAYVLCNLCDYFGLERNSSNVLKFEKYRSLIKELIEAILSTPQKKGGSYGQKTKDEKKS